MTTPTAIAGYLALFVAFGFIFLFVNLVVGKFLRPKAPNAEKLEIYECGEPTIGSSFVQFDIRFYVVALLFIIFDVEVAFFFPWASVFGKATNLKAESLQVVNEVSSAGGAETVLTPAVAGLFRELGVPASAVPQGSELGAAASDMTPAEATTAAVHASADTLARLALIDIFVFFAVLMVGFAYVWRRGDLDWVRAVTAERAETSPTRTPPSMTIEREAALSV
ncbi:MAG: NADH-quinone oxidoreductase subunit A [Pirellulales bacterium]|nr:NADH-quinone oxidoreductase subunit A [Pirellulales bacterium]